MSAPTQDWLPTRTSLLKRLKNWDDQESWKDFFDSYSKLLYSVAIRSGFHGPDAEDLVQDTVIAVAKHIPNFQYDRTRGSFKSWLLSILRHRIIDRVRHRDRRPKAVEEPPGDGTAQTAFIARIPDSAPQDLERIWEEQWEKHLYDLALVRVRAKATPRDFQIFDCLVIKDWPIERVAATLQVNNARIYVAKSRITGLLKDEIEKLSQELQ